MRILDLRDFFLSVTIITIMMPLYVGGWILDSTLELLPIARVPTRPKRNFQIFFVIRAFSENFQNFYGFEKFSGAP